MNPQNPALSQLTSKQKLLLEAALLQGEAAINSWQQWIAAVDIEKIETDSYRLLPLVYRNLSEHGVTDLPARLKGVYRRTWLENQVVVQQLTTILQEFQTCNVETLLLKDAALSLCDYPDFGLRTIHNFNLLVRPDRALAATNSLQKIGWKPQGKIPKNIGRFPHSLEFKHQSGQLLNFRWHLFGDGFQEAAETEFWERAIVAKVGEFPVRVLNATDRLFYVCVTNRSTPSDYKFSRLADAVAILNASSSEVDWDRLLSQAQKYHFVGALQTSLLQLHEILNVPIPDATLKKLSDLPLSELERQEDRIAKSKQKTVLDRFWLRYCQYTRTANQFEIVGFIHYLQYLWGVEHLWQVPVQATIRGMRRIF
jgi:Uncharacterised nucleotidyltransferase